MIRISLEAEGVEEAARLLETVAKTLRAYHEGFGEKAGEALIINANAAAQLLELRPDPRGTLKVVAVGE